MVFFPLLLLLKCSPVLSALSCALHDPLYPTLLDLFTLTMLHVLRSALQFCLSFLSAGRHRIKYFCIIKPSIRFYYTKKILKER